jgi:hypothetical protein
LWGQLGWADAGAGNGDPQVTSATIRSITSDNQEAITFQGFAGLDVTKPITASFTFTFTGGTPTAPHIYFFYGNGNGVYTAVELTWASGLPAINHMTPSIQDSAGVNVDGSIQTLAISVPHVAVFTMNGTQSSLTIDGTPIMTTTTLAPSAWDATGVDFVLYQTQATGQAVISAMTVTQ